MNLKNLTTIVFATILFACTKTDPNQVTITGKITNPIGENVAFSSRDTAYSTTANEDGTFSISFILDSATYLNFGHGIEITAMFVKPGDKIHLTIDTELFDETIKYKGNMESSFLAKKYLITEENDLDDVALFIIAEWETHAIKNQALTKIKTKGTAVIN